MQNQITVTIANATPAMLTALAGAFQAQQNIAVGSPQDLHQALEDKINQYVSARDQLEDMLDLVHAVLASEDGVSDGVGDDDGVSDVQPPNLIRTADDYLNLEVGDDVHWKGAKFEFDATVDDIYLYDDDFLDGDTPDVEEDHKVLFLRRNDTGKRVSLTWPDLQTGELTYN